MSRSTHGRSAASACGQAGIAAIETLLAAPIMLLLGLSVLQCALVFHGHSAVSHAATEAARAGSVDHASSQAILRGLAKGLSPWLYGASGPEEHAANLERAQAHLQQGMAAGWASWRRLAPAAESFADWAETARDADGRPIDGLLEIPNDNLTLRAGMREPASGIAGYRGAEPIGSASGQTLADANLLKIEVVYGVPLTVPVVGRMAAWLMRGLDGCNAGGPAGGAGSEPAGSPGSASGVLRLGTVDLGLPARLASPRAWACAHYNARDESGRARPRWPVMVSATIRMQSPARESESAPPLDTPGTPGPSLGPGKVDGEADFKPIPADEQNPGGASPGGDGSFDRAPGFLKLGGDRLTAAPAICSLP